MYRRWYRMTFVLAMITMVLLTACGGSSGGTTNTGTTSTGDATQFDPNKKYTVDFWEAFGTGANKTAVEALSKEYIQQHPNVTINLQAFDSYGTLQTKLNAAIAANKTPAISQVYESWAVQYKQHDNIVSLQPYIKGKNGLSQSDLADFYPSLLKDGQIDGEQYMLPFNKSDEVLYYNADALQKYNIAPPTSINDLVADITKVTQVDGSQWGLSLTPSVDEWEVLYKSLGGKDLVSQDGQKSAFAQDPNKQYAKAALDVLTPLVKANAVHITQQYAWQNDFASQKSVFAVSTIASYPFLVKSINGAFKFNEAPIPAGPAGQYTPLFGTNLALYKGVSDDTRAVAWDFMKFLTSANADISFVKQTGYMPVRQSAFNSKDLQDYYTKFPARKVGPQQINNAFVDSIQPGWQKCRNDISNNYTSVLKGQITSDAALTKMEQQCNDDLAK
ncbi:MAG: ABC transporter substrate-binding protein [Ktedonobacteraceae bacterium]